MFFPLLEQCYRCCYPCSARECVSCMFGFRVCRVFRKKKIMQQQSCMHPVFVKSAGCFWAFFIAIAQNVPSDCSQKLGDSRIHRKNVFWKGFKSNLNKEPLATTILNPVFVKCVRFLGIFHYYRPECAIWLFPKILGTPGFTEKYVFWKGFKSNFNKEPLATTILNPVFVKCVRFLGIFHCYRPECAIWLFPKICWTPGFTEKYVFWKGFKSNLNKEPLATTILNPVFVTSVGFFGHFSLLSPRMCHLIVPKNLRDSRIHRFFFFWKGFKSNLNKEPLATTILNPVFVTSVGFFVHFSLLSPRMCHLIVPRNCGTAGFTEKKWKGFKSNLNKEPLATTLLNPDFVKCVRFLSIFHCYRPECAIWLFPKNAGLQDSQKNTFFERVSKAI